ncbi:hypothetical protein L211DRAFT_850185 [Terfezia boudieri ATCC MYA-4762]|uniref:Uncharacterized protein n=1 Tax=Terfezia boudieri ATCC MYA-4762 TaxID=1051890 RepID=A0A3N4LPF1_9PEZI|nr:hypothetical protein L211DRAFT_850185 [Terfezia boudieri ATCC MYA-4762]
MGSLSNPVSNGPKCYFLSRLEPEYHTLLSPLINATKHLESFLTYTQIEISEQAFYENVHNNLIYFFKVLHFSCRMLVENAKCRDRIKGSGDVKRIQKVTCVLHDLLISLRWSFMKVEQKSKEYESVVSPRPVLGPNFSDVKDVVDGRAKVLVCRVIIEESLNILHMLERAILELAVEKRQH